jgi:nucleotide-binding universal stress UspA family protein
MNTTSPQSGRAKGAAAEIQTSSGKEVAKASTEGLVIEMVPLVMTLKEILVPIDFSKTALQALNYAVPLAKQFGAKITLVHVVELPRLTPGIEYIGIDASESSLLEKRLKEIARRALPPGVNSDIVVQLGSGYDTIVSVAKARGVDLIVITTHGYTGLKHVLMGSTAEQVVRHAPCPVLVVR